ncbi:MAG TPA: glutamate--tRNA ligase family protein [Parapedobacter sp.]|uniref:glutamate--tRNA ligase family protein n=1 Tax=Parapedobacter sp. TaxID=1958893 RepID=UPI002D18B78A|nr:glutamate--tRNA ligase family protein [Parapedobacter sp.]HWK57368.1 glutamate--tRNA ligase family protein [Parapedobacter sp.]
MQQFLRTRIAPTPSGYLHLGNVLSFAITAVLARQSGARIMLRIDDLDRERVRADYVADIFDTLTYLGIAWDEGPMDYDAYEATYSQVHRLGLYRNALEQLRTQGAVYACDCSRTLVQRHHPSGVYTGRCKHRGLPLDGKGYCWRIDTDKADLPEHVNHFIVRKKDGMPAYQLTSLVDDVHFGVDLVVRGQDLWDSTRAQLFLANELGYKRFCEASFVHHALLKAGAGEKLSKSAGATSIRYLRNKAYSRTDIYRSIGEMAGLPRPISTWEDLMPLVSVFILPIGS